MPTKKLQKSLEEYLSKIKKKKKPTTPQFHLPINSLPSKNWILSACKHPKTQSFTIDRNRDGDKTTLVDVDRFLFENFKSLYINGEDNDKNEDREVSRRGAGKQQDEGENHPFGDVVLFDSPRLIYPPLNLRGSKRFFIAPGSAARSLMEEARSSLTMTSEDIESSSASSTTNTVATSVTTITSAMDPTLEINRPRDEKVKLPDDCIAIVTKTQSPYREFRCSMQEVMESRHLEGAVDWEFMEEMLLCYLDLNDRKSHKHILSAFADLVVALRRVNPNNRATFKSRDVRSNNNKSFGQCKNQCYCEETKYGARRC